MEEQISYLRNSLDFLKCPATEMWMDKHRCPVLMEAIREALNDCVNNPYRLLNGKELPHYIMNVWMVRERLQHNAEDAFCHLVSKEDKRLFLFFLVLKRDAQLLRSCLFPIDEHMYLLPYLFELHTGIVNPTPDHWVKLRDMGFVSKKAMDKYCDFTI